MTDEKKQLEEFSAAVFGRYAAAVRRHAVAVEAESNMNERHMLERLASTCSVGDAIEELRAAQAAIDAEIVSR